MTTPQPLSALSDPGSLAKLQILLVPVHSASSSLSEHTYAYWSSLIKRHAVLRGDELAQPAPSSSHTRGGGTQPRARFLPASSSTSISKGGASNHIHITYPANPPARHLSNLSLLRIAAFPLVVLGIATEEESVNGYTIDEEDGDGDIGSSSSSNPIRTGSGLNESFQEQLAGLFPPTSPFPLVKRLLVVPKDAPLSYTPGETPRKGGRTPSRSGRGKNKASEDIIYAPTEGIESWMGRLLGEVVGDVLGELGELATALETPAGLKTLSSTLLPSLTSTMPHSHLDPAASRHSNSATPTLDTSRSSNATPVSIPNSHSVETLSGHSGMGISLTRALTPGGRPTSIGPPSLPPIQTSAIAPAPSPAPVPASSNPFRRSTAITSPFTRSSSSASLASTAAGSPGPQTVSTGTKYTSAPLSGLAGGRLLKLLGDMYLLAGMYSDAIKCYDDGAERCRSVGDVLWEAVAREGRAVAGVGEAWEARDGSNMTQSFPSSPIPVEILAHFLSALACISRAPIPYPPTILSPSPQAVSGSISFAAPSASNPGAVGTGEGLLAYLHTGLALRISHFLLIIWAAGGWGSIALSALLSHTLPRNFPLPLSSEELSDVDARRKRRRTLGLLGSRSLLTRHSIFDHADSTLGPHHRAMTKAEQLALHVEVVWLARWLDLPRKEACVTREVVKRVAVIVVEAREENRRAQSSSRRPTVTATPDPASVGLGLGMAVPNQAVAVRRRESIEGNTGIIALFERALTLMGLDLLDFSNESTLIQRMGDDPSPVSLRFGWPELQVEMMKEGIAVAESLPDNLAVVRFCTTALNSLHRHLNPLSQGHVARMYPTALGVIRRRGMEAGTLPWWVPGKLVLSLELASLPANRLPVEHSSEEIKATEGKKDPFLYNPRLRAAEAGKTVLVVNEQTEVFITVQNPFAFDLDVQDVSLVTSGVSFITSPHPVSLQPGGMQTIRLSGVAVTPGLLQIRGVGIRLQDGSSTEVLLPLVSDRERSKREKRKSRLAADLSKSKRSGMEARWSMISTSSREIGAGQRDNDIDGKKESMLEGAERWLECSVVEAQPVVWIKKTSLTHGTVMLYDGETSTIKITLENSSSTIVDFIKLSFDDSATRAAQAILSEGELTSEQAYELEWDIVNRPVLSWKADEDMSILPGGRMTVTVTCLGKVGCTDGAIRIDYGCLRKDSTGQASKTFHTRQITFPILFTVYHTLEPHSLDLVRLLPNFDEAHEGDDAQAMSGALDFMRNGSLEQVSDWKHYLLGLNVRNSYGVPFEVSLSRLQTTQDGAPVAVNRLVPPGATERLILLMPRLSLPNEELTKPVPSLLDRQYVVEKSKKSPEQARMDKELFWYRDTLLSSLQATWVEPGSRRSGTMNLRDQGLSFGQLETLKTEDIGIAIEAKPRTGSAITATDFVDIVVSVTNQLARPFKPFIKLEPLPSSSLDTSWSTPHAHPPSRRPQSAIPSAIRNVVFDGTLSRSLGDLEPGETGHFVVGVVFLAEGTFGFRAAVEEVRFGGIGNDLPNVRFSPLLRVNVGP